MHFEHESATLLQHSMWYNGTNKSVPMYVKKDFSFYFHGRRDDKWLFSTIFWL